MKLLSLQLIRRLQVRQVYPRTKSLKASNNGNEAIVEPIRNDNDGTVGEFGQVVAPERPSRDTIQPSTPVAESNTPH